MSARPLLAQTALSILEKINQPVFFIDRSGRLVWVNESAGRFLGYSKNELLSLTIYDLETDLTPVAWASRWEEAGRSGFLEGRSKHRTKDSATLSARWMVNLVKQEDPDCLGLTVSYLTNDRPTEGVSLESEVRYRDLFEGAPYAYFSVRAVDGSIRECNPAAENLLGYDQEAMMKMTVFDLYADTLHGVAKAEEVFKCFRAGEAIRDVELQMKHQDGRLVWISLSVEPVRDDQGRVLESRSMAVDITGRKKVEEDLRKAEEKYRLITDNTSDYISVMTFSLDPVFIYLSPSYKSLGYNPEELIGKSGREVVHPGDIQQLMPLLKKYVSSKEEGFLTGSPMEASEKIEFRVMDAAGNCRWLESTVNAVKNEFLVFVSKDITERKLAEETQRQTEKKYHDIFHNIQDVYYETTIEGEILEVSPAIKEISGYTREALIGRSMDGLYVDPGKRDELIHELLLKKRVTDYEIVLKDQRGTPGYGSINAKLVCDENGRPTKIIGSLRNVTRIKQAETALRESEEMFRGVFTESPIGLELYNAQGRLIEVNRACLDIFGIVDPAEIKGFDLFNDPNLPAEVRAGLPEKESIHYETVFDFERVKALHLYRTTKSGTMDLDIVITRLGRSGRPAFTGYLVHVQDVTARKRTEEQIRILSQELLRAQEAERQRIARELHDHVAQDLSTLKIGCETLFDDQETVPPGIGRKAAELSRRLEGTIQAVRELAYDLNPAGLDRLGLIRTVRRYCRDFSERTGITVEFHSVGLEDSRLDFHTEINLYRLIQEALNNIWKHAGASRATVTLAAAFPKIILRVEDNGQGFDIEKRSIAALKEKRLGLTSMAERANLLGGQIAVKSRPGDGTLISIEIPFQEVNHGGQDPYSDR